MKKPEGTKIFADFLSGIKKIVVFSAHLDDAVLSTGNLLNYLTQNRFDCEVVSVFTEGSSLNSESIRTILARAGHTDSKQYFSARKKEDREALKFLKVKKIKHLGFIDAAWRTDSRHNAIYPNTQLGKISPLDKKMVSEVRRKISSYLSKYHNPAVFAPLAWGDHVDHLITSEAVLSVFPRTVFYLDFPYSIWFRKVSRSLSPKKYLEIKWTSNQAVKKKAVLFYRSQKISLFRQPLSFAGEKFYLPRKILV